MPRFGALDYFVEGLLGELDDEFFRHLVAPSSFSAHRGLIDVVPAIGRASVEHPANVLAKLARAYLEGPSCDGEPVGFLQRTQVLVERLCQLVGYEAVLVDARAGLNETTAAVVLGLGADVLMFAEDTPQTFVGARCLTSHLARFRGAGDDDDWLLRLKWVHAKASPDGESQAAFRDRAFDLCRETLYRGDEFSLQEEAAPHFAWPVLWNPDFAQFDPLREARLLTPELYEAPFSALLMGVRERMDADVP